MSTNEPAAGETAMSEAVNLSLTEDTGAQINASGLEIMMGSTSEGASTFMCRLSLQAYGVDKAER
ncbi:hypothetical protein RBC47_30440 [Pseudomonas fluorescens]|uniref:hypothetical protein n=1 Tax=Pseudomonas fluorescens TaxID=294 RepID=UPI003833BD38